MNAKQRQLRLADYLEHMLEASHLAVEYVSGLDKQLFKASRLVQQGVILNLITIGEASVQIREEYPDFTVAHPEVPWQKLRGMRNRMTHGYFDTDLDIVWETVQVFLPEFQQMLSEYAELHETGSERSVPRADV